MIFRSICLVPFNGCCSCFSVLAAILPHNLVGWAISLRKHQIYRPLPHAMYVAVFHCACYKNLVRTICLQPLMPSVQLLQIIPGAYFNACFFNLFYIPALSRSCIFSRTPDKDQKIEPLFYFLLIHVLYSETSISSTVNGFVHAILKRSKKCLAQKVSHFGSLRLISMFQPPLDSS